jgi:predicted  nucleic acid-binding Zn-ribbon protein
MSAQQINVLNAQIASLDNEITNLNAEITQIDGCTVTGTELQACVNQRKTNLQNNVTSLTNFKTELESKLATLQGGWSASRQTVVDAISIDFSGIYDEHLNNLLRDESEKQDEFFTMYAQADTAFLKELAIKEFFHL